MNKENNPRYYDQVLCCDWGTSSLRVRLIDCSSIVIVGEKAGPLGTAAVYETWKKAANCHGDQLVRTRFYMDTLLTFTRELSLGGALFGPTEVPVIISGMASSGIGMLELPYADLPFSIDGSDAVVRELSLQGSTAPIVLISGVKDSSEVMRGEEVQLIGIAGLLEDRNLAEEVVVVLPGTHSKHMLVCNHQIVNIKTYLTGELFSTLCKNGIMKESVSIPISIGDKGWDAFRRGVCDARHSDLLNVLFRVRTNQVFGKLDKEENYQYMSGLLIGNELRGLIGSPVKNIVLCCEENLFDHYRCAFEAFGLSHRVSFILPAEASLATVRGQLKVFEQYMRHRIT